MKGMNRGAQLLKAFRDRGDMTQMEFCQKFGHGVPTVVSHWEHGRRTPNREIAVLLEEFTGGVVTVASWDQPARSSTRARAA